MCAELRGFGIGDGFENEFDDLTKYQSDESQWFITVDGKRLSLSNNELYGDQGKTCFVKNLCMGRIHIFANAPESRDWTTETATMVFSRCRRLYRCH